MNLMNLLRAKFGKLNHSPDAPRTNYDTSMLMLQETSNRCTDPNCPQQMMAKRNSLVEPNFVTGMALPEGLTRREPQPKKPRKQSRHNPYAIISQQVLTRAYKARKLHGEFPDLEFGWNKLREERMEVNKEITGASYGFTYPKKPKHPIDYDRAIDEKMDEMVVCLRNIYLLQQLRDGK